MQNIAVFIFASGTLGLFVTLFTYGDLIDHSDFFPMLMLENYAVLSCVLYVLYWLLYILVANTNGRPLYGDKKLFRILFAVFSLFMYVGVTAICMNI